MGGDHKCPVCQATFTRPQHVARHMRSHTGDRPYKCQFCGDQFARSDLLSRHVNKCHASEKPLPTTGSTRRKGSASASRATTSKQACDQCVQSSLPCDGSNPCSKCVQRKCRCTYVKFHRQTAPAGPGHHSARPAASSAAVDPSSMSITGLPMSSSLALSSGLGGMSSSIPLSSGASSSRIPLYHPTMSADDDFLLGPPPSLPGPSSHHHHAPSTRGNNGIPTMAETLYGSNSFDFPPLYPPTGTTGSVGSTSSDGGDVDSEYVVAAKYRAQAQAELFCAGRTGDLGYGSRPSSSSAAASSAVTGGNNPHAWLGWDQHPHPHQNPHHQHMRQDGFSHQHPHQQQHSGSQRISSQPVDLSGSDGGLGGGGGGGGFAMGASSSLHDNPSHFMHAARRNSAAIAHSQAQAHGHTPPPHRQRDVHEGLDLRLGGMGATHSNAHAHAHAHGHGHGNVLEMGGGMGVGVGVDGGMESGMGGMGGMGMSMPMPLPPGMNLGLGGFMDGGGGGGGRASGEEEVDVGMMLGMGMYHPKYGAGGGDNTGRYYDIDRAATASTSTTASSESSRSSHHGHTHHGQQRSDDSDDMNHGKQRFHGVVGATDDDRRQERQEFNNAFGLMSLDDPNANVGEDGEAFFSDPAQAHNCDHAESSAGSMGGTTTTSSSTTTVGESRNRPHTTTSNTNEDMDTPMPMKRISGGLLQFPSGAQLSTPSREGDTKELRDFWRAYIHTPLSDAGDSGNISSKGTPLAAGGGASGYGRKRVASLPSSKTPIVERDMRDMGVMYGVGGAGGEQSVMYSGMGAMRAGAGVQQHHGNNQREDLRSYEAAVMARKAPTTLNLRPRVGRGRGGDANHASASTQNPQLSHSASASSLTKAPFQFGLGDTSPGHGHAPLKHDHEGSTSPSIPSSSSRSSSCVVDDSASDTADSMRPSFKRLPSQTLGPNNAKRAFLGRGVGHGDSSPSTSGSTLGMGGGMNMHMGSGMGMNIGMGMQMNMGTSMGGFEGVDFDSHHHHPAHMQDPSMVGMMTGLSHPDRVVKSLAERRRRKRRMSAPTSGSGVVGLGLGSVEGDGEGGNLKVEK